MTTLRKILFALTDAHVQRRAFPEFDCENCIGMPEHGCYCGAHDASAPGVGPTFLQRLAQWWVRR